MYLYELSYLISPELSEEELNNHMEEINNLIAKEGELKKTESLGLKNLGRFIKEKKTAYLVSSLFELEPEKLPLLKEEIKKNQAVFQSIIIRKKKEKMRKERAKRPREEGEENKITKEEPGKKEKLEKIGEKLDEILKD
jgi:ribosomal protein S6